MRQGTCRPFPERRISFPWEGVLQTHEVVGKEVRSAIEKIGGTLPENIPPAEHIKNVKKRLKTSKPRLELDPKDAAGIVKELL